VNARNGGLPGRLPAGIARALVASDRRIVIAGAGGWLGLATLELLENALGADFAGRVRCYGSSARTLTLRNGVSIEQRPLAEITLLEHRPTIVLHLAFLTKDRVDTMDEAEYRAANRKLSDTVLKALDPIGATAVFVASSGAARYAADPAASHALRLYGALKKRDEDAFAAWAEDGRKTAVVARLFNLVGPYINKLEHYALAAFILDALAGRPIKVRAPHRVVRGFVAVREVMALVFSLLLEEGQQVTLFDTGGAAHELAEVAGIVAAALGPVSVERAPIVSERIDDYVGDAAAYALLLVEHDIEPIPLDLEIRDTADFLVATLCHSS
jgi:UDP-glucuronate decarboxylase